ncbi:MAG: hypothetical protein WA102_13870 [Candidatus Methanoperedens sp.]
MYLDKQKIIPGTLILAATIFILANPASAGVEISDFFSDFTSSDVTVNSTQDFYGKAVFELYYSGSPVESQAVTLNMRAGEPVYKVIIWQNKPQYDYYTAKVSIYNNSKLLTATSYQVSYNTAALPGFHVVDFSPSNSGVQLLLRPFNPSAADIKIELLDNNDVVYTKINEDISLKTLPEEIKTTWPFLLTGNKNYIVRVKIFTHRLYAPVLVNTYIAKFTATEDVEILADDVQVDEYGASVTIRGKSQVPFDGFIVVMARNRATNETKIFRQQMEEILLSGKEDTAGVVWKGLAPGTYDVEILAQDKENVTVDKYETVLRIPESSAATVTATAKGTPGFTAFLLVAMLLLVARRLKGG